MDVKTLAEILGHKNATVTLNRHRNNTDLISSFYFLYCPGVTPNLFLNTVLNCDKFENPTA